MPTTRKPAVRSAAAPVKPVVPVKPSAKMAATPAGKSAAAKVAKAKAAKANGKAGKAGHPVQAAPTKTTKAAKPAMTVKAPKADKPKKPKLVRDTFTMPKSEYAVLDALKARAARSGKTVKKSELLRAGIKALAALPELAFGTALDSLPASKADRPAKA